MSAHSLNQQNDEPAQQCPQRIQNEVIHIPTVAREVFDVSGAGDTVIATLATMLGSGKTVAEAVNIANRAGGIVVGKLGTATVTTEELFG